MKAKEIKTLAKKIAQQEKIVQTTTDMDEKARAEKEIVRLSSCVKTIDDMIALDEAIQDLMLKN